MNNSKRKEYVDTIRKQYFDAHRPERKLPNSFYIIIPEVASFYIRDKGIYPLNGELYNTLTLANISVEESKQNQGIGSLILDTLLEINPYDLFIGECVHNPISVKMLKDRNFFEDTNRPNNYFRFSP